MNSELRREISLQINYLGESELQLGCLRSETKDVGSIVAEINKHRDQFSQGKIVDFAGATFASADSWKAIAAESERAARNELLKSSSELTELTELERKAEEARRLAETKNRELEALWNEYQRLPGKADRINTKLASLKADRESLDVEKLNADFRDFYRAILDGALVDRMGLVFQAGVIATRDLRLEVIGQLETKLQAELAELRKRNKELSKRLGRKQEI